MNYQDTGLPSTQGQISTPRIPEQLEWRKKDLEKTLEEVNKAIEILKKNPELADLLTILRRHA